MTDIVDRLRKWVNVIGTGETFIIRTDEPFDASAVLRDAIAEIERLRADVTVAEQMSGFRENGE